MRRILARKFKYNFWNENGIVSEIFKQCDPLRVSFWKMYASLPNNTISITNLRSLFCPFDVSLAFKCKHFVTIIKHCAFLLMWWMHLPRIAPALSSVFYCTCTTCTSAQSKLDWIRDGKNTVSPDMRLNNSWIQTFYPSFEVWSFHKKQKNRTLFLHSWQN